MKKLLFPLLTVLIFGACNNGKTSSVPVDMIENLHDQYVGVPWGMNLWQIRNDNEAKFCGFCQSHDMTDTTADYGRFTIMPISDNVSFEESDRASEFSIANPSDISPCHYRAYLSAHHVLAELTATERCAQCRFTYDNPKEAYVVIDAFEDGSYLSIVPEENKIVGFSTAGNAGKMPDNFRNYFVIKFDRPFTYTATVNDGKIDSGSLSSENEGKAGAIVGFATADGKPLVARVASSFISVEQAENNLAEVQSDFDAIKEAGIKKWNNALGHVKVNSRSKEKSHSFYTHLYKSLLSIPSEFEYDREGNPIHYSPYNGLVCEGYMFHNIDNENLKTDLTLMNLLYPSTYAKMQESLANTYHESGKFGNTIDPSFFVDAFKKTTKGADADYLWDAVKYDSYSQDTDARQAYKGWCIYRLGKMLGRSDTELNTFAENALRYEKNDSIETPVALLLAVHDVLGLIDSAGGKDAFNHVLDTFFSNNYKFTPAAYLYNYSGMPWKSQHLSRELLDKEDDNASYVFAALGFYPLCPGSEQYVIGSPNFESAEISLENGKKIIIEAANNNEKNHYISEMKLNGKVYDDNYLTHNQLLQGAKIEYQMSGIPNTKRGCDASNTPYSFSNEIAGL
ncbi:MAG: glycoside hydrolase family 92 protein [Muribaculaceae bacterium]|nr:glycoside hydrolase family 92 protein [Muribaculaceae bacterium]